jgi:electron transport complex protein RnfC
MFSSFRGGIHPDDKKPFTHHKPIEVLPPPEYVTLPLSMHIGAPCETLVKVGDEVLMGQIIADSTAPVSSPIHASISGTVTEIGLKPHPNGSLVQSIVIHNDEQERYAETVAPYGSVESLTSDELLQIIRDSGIVGMGGAAFPTHAKIQSGMGKVSVVLINGCECEPYITSDHRLMLEAPEEIIGGLKILMKIFQVTRGIIAIEANKRDAIESIRKMLPRNNTGIEVKSLTTHYPQGAEKQLIDAVLHREVPPGSLPADVGTAVFNVGTVAAIHRGVTTGLPLIQRIITVSGGAVSNAKNLMVRIGTSMETVFSATGGFRETPGKVLMGGPMMGISQFDLTAPVIKATNSLLAFSRTDLDSQRERLCIRCGKCVQICPLRLEPIYLYLYERKNRLDMLDKLHINDCIECGCCSYVCPGHLHLVHSIRTGKQMVRALSAKGGK